MPDIKIKSVTNEELLFIDKEFIIGEAGEEKTKYWTMVRNHVVNYFEEVVMLDSDSYEGFLGRGRNGPYGPPPAQIRTCGTTAYGSCVEYAWRQNGHLDRGGIVSALGCTGPEAG